MLFLPISRIDEKKIGYNTYKDKYFIFFPQRTAISPSIESINRLRVKNNNNK